MANSKISGVHQEWAVVDTDPGSAGYSTNAVNPRQEEKETGLIDLIFTIKGSGVCLVDLEYLDANDSSWNTYDTYTENGSHLIEGMPAGRQWRASVNSYTSGTKTFGFSW